MRKIILLVVWALSVHMAVAANIASMNPDKILNASQAWVDIKQRIDSYAENVQSQVIEKQKKLEQNWAIIKQLREDPKNRQQLVEKEKQFMDESAKLQDFVQAAKDNMESAYIQARNTIQDTIFAIVEQIATQNAIEVVVTETEASFNSPYLYIKPSISINDAVIKILNEKLPKIAITLEVPDAAP